jgi:aspartyl protease family protein
MCRATILTLVALICATAAAARADDAALIEQLEGKGLRKLDAYFLLPDESDLLKDYRELATIKRQVLKVSKEEETAQKLVDAKKKQITAMLQQRQQLRAALDVATSANQQVRLINAINSLADQVELLERDTKAEDALKEARGAANQVREQYVGRVLEIRKTYNALSEKYDDLSADPDVKAALASFNEGKDKTANLGPTRSFIVLGTNLKKVEDTVISDEIDLRPDGGRLFNLPVTFDGKYTQELGLDTGSSLLCLPSQMAKEVGLVPKDSDPTVRLQMANGQVVEAKLLMVKSVRVGKFEVENVECAVFPPELTEAAAILGMNFLEKFNYKIDTERAKLIMNKIEAGQ